MTLEKKALCICELEFWKFKDYAIPGYKKNWSGCLRTSCYIWIMWMSLVASTK